MCIRDRYKALRKILVSLEFEPVPGDPCCYCIFLFVASGDRRLMGWISVHVDDCLLAGGRLAEAVWERLKKRLQFKTWLRLADGVRKFCGRWLSETSLWLASLVGVEFPHSRFESISMLAVAPECVDKAEVNNGLTASECKLNAKYAISCAHKMGCRVFLTWEDIVEVKPKMILTLLAAAMQQDMLRRGRRRERAHKIGHRARRRRARGPGRAHLPQRVLDVRRRQLAARALRLRGGPRPGFDGPHDRRRAPLHGPAPLARRRRAGGGDVHVELAQHCLLYTSDAADE